MDKLEAIREIVYANDVIDSSKLAGIRRVFESNERSAEATAIAFSTPREEYHRRLKGELETDEKLAEALQKGQTGQHLIMLGGILLIGAVIVLLRWFSY